MKIGKFYPLQVWGDFKMNLDIRHLIKFHYGETPGNGGTLPSADEDIFELLMGDEAHLRRQFIEGVGVELEVQNIAAKNMRALNDRTPIIFI